MRKQHKPNESFNIGFFELLYLGQECIPPTITARSMFFEKLSMIYWHEMNRDQRETFFNSIINHERFSLHNGSCAHFYNRFNPDNQYKIEVKDAYTTKNEYAYLHNEEYHITKERWIKKEEIVKVEKMN